MKKILLSILCFTTFLLILIIVKKETKQQNIPLENKESVRPVADFEFAINQIDPKELNQSLHYLASEELEGRMSGKKGNVIAANFIKKKFEDLGLKTVYHKFPIKRSNPGPKNEQGDDFTQNIYAVLEGNDENLKDQIVVIGAHMDHIGYGPSMSRSPSERKVHPGADDNASGTVALLEIAKAFSVLKGQNKRTVVFQAYSAEEMGLIGSRFYCDNPLYPENKPDIKKHIFMLNMDMVGYLGKGQYNASFQEGNSSVDLGRIIKELNEKYDFAKKISVQSGGSDHASFYNKRVPVVFLHTGGHPYYHTPRDTPDRINYEGVEKIARYAFELSWRIANETDPPQFNHALFKEMDYTHDHGHSDMLFQHRH